MFSSGVEVGFRRERCSAQEFFFGAHPQDSARACENAVINLRYFLPEAPLAQLDRASGYEPEGREFESLRAHHYLKADNAT